MFKTITVRLVITLAIPLALVGMSVTAAPIGPQTGNLLDNGSVETGLVGPVVGHGIASAADHWFQWSNSGALLTSELVSSTDMISTYGTDVIDGSAALRFTTGGRGDGGFSFNTDHAPPWSPTAELTFSGWVYVVSGTMPFQLGANVPGTFSLSTSLTTGALEFVSITRAAGLMNEEALLYSIGGPAEFIVDALWLNYGPDSLNPLPTPVPAPLTLSLLAAALPACRRRA
jgi:hypothetical protein